jgi:hypothetical protein
MQFHYYSSVTNAILEPFFKIFTVAFVLVRLYHLHSAFSRKRPLVILLEKVLTRFILLVSLLKNQR